jgi:hypothetical protein
MISAGNARSAQAHKPLPQAAPSRKIELLAQYFPDETLSKWASGEPVHPDTENLLKLADAAERKDSRRANQLLQKIAGVQVSDGEAYHEQTGFRYRAEGKKAAVQAFTFNTKNESGPLAIQQALQSLTPEKIEAEGRRLLATGKKTSRPRAIELLNIARGLKRNRIDPEDFMISKIPVLPAHFRPFSVTGDRVTLGDANDLYRDVIHMRDAFSGLKAAIGEEHIGDDRLRMMDTVRAVTGFGDPVNPKTKNRGVTGFLHKVIGSGPKFGWVSSKLIAKPVDNTGRGVIVPNADLGMDEISIGEEAAWKVFKDATQRLMSKQGIPLSESLKMIKERTPRAKHFLDGAMKEYPVVYSRAPSWWEYSVRAGHAKLHDGDHVSINTFVTNGLNADFDGDDCINKVIIGTLRNAKNTASYENSSLTQLASDGNIANMFQKLIVPVLGPDYQVSVVDLEDFPHGEFSNTVQGQNGPIHFFNALPGTKVLAFAKDGVAWADVKWWSRHEQRAVEIVTLSNGKQIITDDDPRAVFGVARGLGSEERRFTPTAAKICKVAVPTAKGDMPEAPPFPVKIGNVDVKQDKDFGYFLGAIAGDGWWDKKDYSQFRKAGSRMVYLSDLKGHAAARVGKWLQTYTDNKVSVAMTQFAKADYPGRYGDTARFSFSFDDGGQLARWLDANLDGHRDDKTTGSGNKRLPGFVFTASRDFREGLLAGLMDTDGTVAVSFGKKTPQLQLAFSSTSLRLVRDVQVLCRTLGVESTVTFSKITSRGNSAWALLMSAVDAKEHTLLGSEMQDPDKRGKLNTTEVKARAGGRMYDAVVFPKQVSDLVGSFLRCPRTEGLSGTELETVLHQQKIYGKWFSHRQTNVISRQDILDIEQEVRASKVSYRAAVSAGAQALSISQADGLFDRERVKLVRAAFYATVPEGSKDPSYKKVQSSVSRTNAPLKAGKISPKVAENLRETLLSMPKPKYLEDYPIYQEWKQKYFDTGYEWAVVTKVERTGKKEDGYDLTVPGYETFMSADGVILSNTINFHVPVLPETRKEALEKLLPSKSFFNPKDNGESIVPTVKQDQVSGLFSASKNKSNKVHRFRTEAEAVAAIEAGTVGLSDQVDIG